MSEPAKFRGRLTPGALGSIMKLAREQGRVSIETICALFDGVEVDDPRGGAGIWWLITKVEPGEQHENGQDCVITALLIDEPNPHGFATGGVVANVTHIVGERPSETVIRKDRLL